MWFEGRAQVLDLVNIGCEGTKGGGEREEEAEATKELTESEEKVVEMGESEEIDGTAGELRIGEAG